MDEDQLRQVYEMVDSIPLSRPKKNISRDFSDAAMMAEVLQHYRSELVALHNYPTVNSTTKKIANWNTLNTKVLKKIGLALTKPEIQDIANSKPYAIEAFLYRVLIKFESPEDEVHIRNQIERPPPSPRNEPQRRPGDRTPPPRGQSPRNSTPINSKKPSVKPSLPPASQTDEVIELIDEIEQSYSDLLKLQEMSRLKDEVLKNLEKKIEKMIFS